MTFALKEADQRPTRDSFGGILVSSGKSPGPNGLQGSERSEAVSTTSAEQKIFRPEGPEWSERSDAVGTTLEDRDWHAAWLLARASADGGQLDLAEEQCQQAITRAHFRPEPYYLLATLRLAQGDDVGSLEAHRKALYVDPRFVPALLAQAATHRRVGAQAKAHQALLRAQRLLEGRQADEWVLADDGLTVGRLRDALREALRAEEMGA
jgi:tetratricopeptide (TPR) repeat protein